MSEAIYHIPALFEEAIAGLDIKPGGVYVDVTFGGGGHSRGILSRLGPEGKLYGFDRDMDAFANVPDDSRFTFVHSNYRYLSNFLRFHGEEKVDGILADLGVSFHHFDSAERGFSFRNDAPLDMRMNRRGGITASEILATYDESQLTSLFRTYTDLKKPFALAKALVGARAKDPVTTTFRLADTVRPFLNPRQEKKDMAQVFQALRIEVNGEMEALKHFLQASAEKLREGGRLAVITYHSIEDRIVKNFIKTGNVEGIEEKDFFGKVSTPWKAITRSPIVPGDEEVERNPRSRSAKLRIAEKL
ncbi:MAG: 16S rRNA (cytosine(1402)-N(4))-methyltransferase RsmH [Muribaculaceae bacterium]|nr:16S rRNA (cytosine(1402)-N(4))-methyltransferase RsmH [Muribaculaceae bacterium]